MPLLDLWGRSRAELEGKQVQQIIAIAGSGKLLDGGDGSKEFRDFLSHVPSTLLVRYAGKCLNEKFESGGLALQDVVNQVGSRLGSQVEDGRYRGSSGQSGHDGLWKSSLGVEIVVEVKTTDAYRVALDAIAEYRKKLIQEAKVVEATSSILIVVGRQDTGDLEAQIRGSRHAWDIRLVSVDSLIRLMFPRRRLKIRKCSRKLQASWFHKNSRELMGS